MEPKKAAKRCLILAAVWTVAAAAVAVGIILALPGVAPMPALLFGLCAVCALCWWGSFIREKKLEKKEKKEK